MMFILSANSQLTLTHTARAEKCQAKVMLLQASVSRQAG